MKIAFLFAGQGSQYVGMGKELYETEPVVKEVFDNIQVDFDVKKLCFEGPVEQLNDTQYTQVCMFAHSMACAKLLEKHGIKADAVAGLSLGEYSALCYANSFSLQDGASILRERGKLMASALPKGTSAMSAVLMLDKTSVLQACKDVSSIGICEVANYNCPGQIVISGEKAAVEEAGKKCLEYGARRVIPLSVSGAFHCSLLKESAKKLESVLENYTLKEPTIDVYHNVSGTTHSEDLQDTLVKQLYRSVYFEQTITNMLEDGIDTFIELGAGKVLSGFVKKCGKGKNVNILHVEDITSLQTCLDALKG